MDAEDEYESLPPFVGWHVHMVAGASAGMLEHTVMFPFDTVKVCSENWSLNLGMWLPARRPSLRPLPPAYVGGGERRRLDLLINKNAVLEHILRSMLPPASNVPATCLSLAPAGGPCWVHACIHAIGAHSYTRAHLRSKTS